MGRALGLIAFEGDRVRIEGLYKHRPLMSVSFFGRYRLIDFPISNMTNSNITSIHVYVKEKPRSVFEHVGTGRHYNINSKQGKIRIMFGEAEMSSAIYNTDVRAYLSHLSYILEDPHEYVVIAPSHFVYTQDYGKVLEQHKASGADVTVLYHDTNEADTKFLGCDTLVVDMKGRILHSQVNLGNEKEKQISLESYVLRKSLFVELLYRAQDISNIIWFKDVLAANLGNLNVRGYGVGSTVLAMVDLKSYYQNSMSITPLKSDLFRESWPIYTRTQDTSPTHYGPLSEVSHSSIANGAIINGRVENSIIGRNVIVDQGAVVKNSIVLPSSRIYDGVTIDCVVVDKHVEIKNTKEIIGSPDNPIYINRHDKI